MVGGYYRRSGKRLTEPGMTNIIPFMTESMLKRKQTEPVYTTIVNQISDLIKQGELRPGDQLLSERELCEQFGVSRTSVRKALAILSGMGLVDVTPRDGAYVKQPGTQQAIDSLSQIVAKNRHQAGHLYEVRRLIEVQAARLAAMRRDEADVVHLWETYRRTEESIRQGQRVHEADMDFHIGIAQVSKNPFFSELMTVLISAFMDIFDIVWARAWNNPEEDQLYEHFIEQHRLIVEAIAAQDPDAAASYMTQHIEDSRKRVERVMREKSAAQHG